MKRIIKRHRFLEDKKIDEAQNQAAKTAKVSVEMTLNQPTNGGRASTEVDATYGGISETYPLTTSGKKSTSGKDKSKQVAKIPVIDETAEFFPFLIKEIDNVNKFFVGKLAELRINLELLISKRSNAAFGHHTSSETDILTLRDIYIDLRALKGYCELNTTGATPLIFLCFLSLPDGIH